MTSPSAPAVSVILAVLDGGVHLGEQLEALSSQVDAPRFEVIVADNGSTDDSSAVVSTFRERLDIRMIDASEQRGQTFARNRGVEAAGSELLLILDQDDVVDERYVASMADALTRHEFVAARMDVGRLNAPWVAAARAPAQLDSTPTTPVHWAYGCTIGVRRRTFESIGGFDTDLYVSAEDIDFAARAANLGIELVDVPDALLHYRLPDSSRALFRQGRRYGIGYEFVARKHGFDRDPALSRLRKTLGSVRMAASRHRARRAQGWFLLGRRWGSVEGRVRVGVAIRTN